MSLISQPLGPAQGLRERKFQQRDSVPSLPLPTPNNLSPDMILVNEKNKTKSEARGSKKCQGDHQDMVLSLKIVEGTLAISLPPSGSPG